MTGESRRLRADAARNRQALIDAAQRLFASRGLAVSLDGIAAEAGVNVATAYRHFANKQELATAFLQRVIDDAVGIVEQAAANDDPWEGLREFFLRTYDFMTVNRGLHDLFTPGVAEPWLRQLDERVEPVLRRLLTRGQRAKLVRGDLQPGDVAVIFQMLSALTDIPTDDPDRVSRRYIELVLAGLRPSKSALPGGPPDMAATRAATASRSTRKRAATRPGRRSVRRS